jgi:diphthine-ammonia ligase
MELYSPVDPDSPETFKHQAVLALQHLYRIGAAVGVRRWTSVIAFITSPSADAAKSRASVARRVWHEVHIKQEGEGEDGENDEDEDFDVWDQQRGGGRGAWQSHATEQAGTKGEEQNVPPIYVIEVDSLPRGASVEWVAYGSTSSRTGTVAIPHLAHLLQMFKDCVR